MVSLHVQVGLMRRGRYVKGKKVGKGNLANDVRMLSPSRI